MNFEASTFLTEADENIVFLEAGTSVCDEAKKLQLSFRHEVAEDLHT